MSTATSLQGLMVKELQDLYSAERQLTKALPKLSKAAVSDELRDLIDAHLQETEGHVERIERAFEMLETKATAKHCAGIAGIITESEEFLSDGEDGAVRDAGIIAGAQRAEHYEIAAYGAVVSWARMLGRDDVADLLTDTLAEEKGADRKLNDLAKGSINQDAMSGEPVGAGHGKGTSQTPKRERASHASRSKTVRH